MKPYQIAFLLLVCFAYAVKAQPDNNRKLIDSLRIDIPKEKNDSLLFSKLFRLAKTYYDIDKDSTHYYIKQTMALAESNKYAKRIGNAYYYKGWLQKKERDYTAATQSLDTAIQYLTNAKDTFLLSYCLSDFGLCHWRLGHFDKSLKAYNQILSFDNRPALKKSKLAAIINSALIYEEQERPKEAEKKYKKALFIADEMGDQYGELIIYNNLSSIYRQWKQFPKSINYSHKSITLCKEIEHQFELRRSLANLGATYTQMKRNDSALYYLQKAYQIGLDMNDGANNVKTSWHLAELYLNTNKLDKARNYANISLRLAQKLKIPEDIAFGYEMLYDIESKAQNYRLSTRWADSLVYWRDSLNRSNNQEALANAEASYNNKLLLKDNTIQATKIEGLAKEKKYLSYLLMLALFISGLVLFGIWNVFKKKKIQRELEMEMDHTIKLTESVEEYRKKRAAELHDDVGQDLLLAQQSMQLDNPKERTQQFVERALNKVRKISKDEYPYELNYIGLKASLEYLIDLIEQNADIVISESIMDLPTQIPESQMLNMYRVIQEMLNNSIKNKDTTAVFIGMEVKDNFLEINYRDNGSGFDFEEHLNKGKSVGLKSIVNRVRMMKAELKFVPLESDNRYQIIIPFVADQENL